MQSNPAQIESPFSRLLCTNTAPSDAECEAIRQFLSMLKKEFVTVTAEIAQMQTLLADMANQSERLREAIEAHQALVSLVRNPVMNSQEAPLLLAHVCSGWRKIALATPQLWSSLHVVVPNSVRLWSMCSAVDVWLARSGTLPLSITLAVSAVCERSSDDVATMIDVLVKFSLRWKRVKITLTPRTVLTPLTNLRVSDVPMLESIAFTSIGSGFWMNVVTPFPIPWRSFNFISSPSIRRVSIASLGGNFLSLALPWPLLQSLNFSATSHKNSNSYQMTVIVALVILRQCPNLTQCTICLTSGPELDPPIPTDPSINGLSFFETLHVPALKHLEYRGPKYDGSLPFSSILPTIYVLQSLSIDILGLTKNAFQECLTRLPSLASFRLESDSGGEYDPWTPTGVLTRENRPATADEILRLLTPNPRISIDCPWPLLKRLDVMWCKSLSDSVVLDFLESRAEEPVEKPLERVEIVFPRQMEFDIVKEIPGLVAQGLQIKLKYLRAPSPPKYSLWEGRDAMASMGL
ncbi:F-box domain-containing protein [Mycena sanguinolenta]|uniref:F-box domain-containing protein n=1 Tax=Mycena sanguinolenta TaxID=230812 RepID=A0A8H6ZAZ4_9AGAR|nr:F-box domain-containing protein [Mycena sanguinolenta]